MLEEISSWQQLRTAIAADSVDELVELVAEWPIDDLSRALSRMDEHEVLEFVRLLPSHIAAEVLEELPSAYSTDVIEHLVTAEATRIVAELPSDEQADLLVGVADAEREAILDGLEDLDPASAAETQALLQHAANSAGALMTLDFLQYAGDSPCRQVLRRVADAPAELSRYVLQIVYVVDPHRRLWGSVRTRELVDAGKGSTLDSIVSPSAAVNVAADLNTLRRIFDLTDDLALPVTDDSGTLLGVVTRDKVESAFTEQAASEHLKSQGILTEELRSMPVPQRAKRRLSWLSVNIVLNLMAASVIAAFEDTLTAVIALAVFLPIVSDMSGCSGNQAVAVSMRELTLGIVRPKDTLYVWWQEVKVGLINGVALGILLCIAAYLWKGSPVLGAVVGIALCLNTLIAVSIGGCVPLLLKRFNVDPAVASGPVLTTVTDMCGFLLVLGLATLALPWL